MHTRSTLDWTQSSNIFVKYIKLVFDWTVYLVLVDRDDLRGFWKFWHNFFTLLEWDQYFIIICIAHVQ